MTDETAKWTVCRTTAHGSAKWWEVDQAQAEVLMGLMAELVPGTVWPVTISTMRGAALIWMVPGQTLTVEKSND